MNKILQLFTSENLQDYIEIIKQCDSLIASQKNNASAYYFRAMAKMGIALSQEFNNTLLYQAIPVGISSGRGTPSSIGIASNFGKKVKKFEEHYKIADSAIEDYNKALRLDSNIRQKYNIKIRTYSAFTSAAYIFYRPIPSKELVHLLAANRKYIVLAIGTALLLILPFLLMYFDSSGDNFSSKSLFLYISYGLCLAFYTLFASNHDKSILKKYCGDIIVIDNLNHQ